MRPTLPRQCGSAVGVRSQVHGNGRRPPADCQEPVVRVGDQQVQMHPVHAPLRFGHTPQR